MMVLPGDKMFQSQYVAAGKTRPVILHGYGNAKRAMKEGLTSLAGQGWKPMASAMVGTGANPPIWACNDWSQRQGPTGCLNSQRRTTLAQPVGTHSLEATAHHSCRSHLAS